MVYEVFFYFIIAIVLLVGRPGWALIVAWTAAILVYSGFGDPTVWPESFLLDSRNLEFIIGILVARYLIANELPIPKTFVAGGLASFFGMIALKYLVSDNLQPLCGYLLFGLSAAAVIGGAVELERRGRIAFGPMARLLGAASFSIYLVHSLVEPPTCAFAYTHLRGLKPEIIWAAPVLVGIGAGILFHIFIEKRVTRYARKLLLGPAPVTA